MSRRLRSVRWSHVLLAFACAAATLAASCEPFHFVTITLQAKSNTTCGATFTATTSHGDPLDDATPPGVTFKRILQPHGERVKYTIVNNCLSDRYVGLTYQGQMPLTDCTEPVEGNPLFGKPFLVPRGEARFSTCFTTEGTHDCRHLIRVYVLDAPSPIPSPVLGECGGIIPDDHALDYESVP